MTKKHNQYLLYLLLVLVACFWGGAFIAGKIVVKEIPPYTVATLRFGLASLLLVPFMIYKEGNKAIPALSDLPWLALLGLTGIAGYNALFFTGLKYTTATNGSLIIAANPMVTAIFSLILLKERLNFKQTLGIIISFTGVLMVISKGSPEVLTSLEFNRGDLMLAGAMTLWAVYSIAGKKVMNKFSPLVSTTYACLFGAIMLFPFAIAEGGLSQTFNYSWPSYAAIIYTAVFASVLGFVWWYQGVQKIGASKASIFVNLVPISAMLMAVLFMGEQVNPNQLLGAGLVISGVYLTSKSGTKVQVNTTVQKTIDSK